MLQTTIINFQRKQENFMKRKGENNVKLFSEGTCSDSNNFLCRYFRTELGLRIYLFCEQLKYRGFVESNIKLPLVAEV